MPPATIRAERSSVGVSASPVMAADASTPKLGVVSARVASALGR
jgi:hypothetical protein